MATDQVTVTLDRGRVASLDHLACIAATGSKAVHDATAERYWDETGKQLRAALNSPEPCGGGGLTERVKAELHSESDQDGSLAGALGEAIAEAAGSYSLEFCEVEKVAEGICNWLATQPHPASLTEEALKGPVERLERIRDLDEELSDGSLGSLARRALDEIAALLANQDRYTVDRVTEGQGDWLLGDEVVEAVTVYLYDQLGLKNEPRHAARLLLRVLAERAPQQQPVREEGAAIAGQCSHCGTTAPLAGDGTIDEHRAPEQLSGICWGAGKTPAPQPDHQDKPGGDDGEADRGL